MWKKHKPLSKLQLMLLIYTVVTQTKATDLKF